MFTRLIFAAVAVLGVAVTPAAAEADYQPTPLEVALAEDAAKYGVTPERKGMTEREFYESLIVVEKSCWTHFLRNETLDEPFKEWEEKDGITLCLPSLRKAMRRQR